jgi:hypothetical protein
MNEIAADWRLQVDLYVSVFHLRDEADEPAVTVEKVVLVAEQPGVPGKIGCHRQIQAIANAVEREIAVDRGDGFVTHRQIVDAELVLACRPQHQSQLFDALPLDPQVSDSIDGRSGLPELLTRDSEVGRRIPEGARSLDVVPLTSGRVGKRRGGELRVRVGGQQEHRVRKYADRQRSN